MHTTCKPGAARADAHDLQAGRRERVARAVVHALAGAAAVALFYAASEPEPASPDTYRAEAWDGSTVARGLTMPQCLENYFNRPAVAGCILED